MKIDEIIPYKRNARHNDKAIPAVADSIKEFGLRGQILLESKENPVIVCGHTRVAACKSLGWDEIPDEHVAFCDDMTDEQIKAFRIADNKTGDIATYNISMLKSEVASIKGLDMSRFGCDFKSKIKPYGAERLKTDKAYNLDLVNRDDCGPGGFPELQPVDVVPETLAGFNYAKTTPKEQKKGVGCHFFIDDYQFERLWTSPGKYLDCLRGYECIIEPDFSMYLDMPDPMQRWNRYRSQALAYYWARCGFTVVPSVAWAEPESYEFCFSGMPRNSTVAVSTVGVLRDKEATAIWQDGMREAMRRLAPSRVLLYGSDIDFDFGGVEVIRYSNSVTDRMGEHGRTR